MKPRRKPQHVEGTIVQIPYGDNRHRYGQLLVEPFLRVFDTPPNRELDGDGGILEHDELFRVAIFTYGIAQGRWPVVGHRPVPAKDRWIPDQFVQDRYRPTDLRIVSTTYDGVSSERPATITECEGLEAVSVWDPVHMEQRLADHDAGVPNIALLSARLIRPGEVFTVLLHHGRDSAGHQVVSGVAHAEVRAGSRVTIERSHGPALTVATVSQTIGGPAVPFLACGSSGALILTGQATEEQMRSTYILHAAMPDAPDNQEVTEGGR